MRASMLGGRGVEDGGSIGCERGGLGRTLDKDPEVDVEFDRLVPGL